MGEFVQKTITKDMVLIGIHHNETDQETPENAEPVKADQDTEKSRAYQRRQVNRVFVDESRAYIGDVDVTLPVIGHQEEKQEEKRSFISYVLNLQEKEEQDNLRKSVAEAQEHHNNVISEDSMKFYLAGNKLSNYQQNSVYDFLKIEKGGTDYSQETLTRASLARPFLRGYVAEANKSRDSRNVGSAVPTVENQARRTEDMRFLAKFASSYPENVQEAFNKMKDSVMNLEVSKVQLSDEYVKDHIDKLINYMEQVRSMRIILTQAQNPDDPFHAAYEQLSDDEKQLLTLKLAEGSALGKFVECKAAQFGLKLGFDPESGAESSEDNYDKMNFAHIPRTFTFIDGTDEAQKTKAEALEREDILWAAVKNMQVTSEDVDIAQEAARIEKRNRSQAQLREAGSGSVLSREDKEFANRLNSEGEDEVLNRVLLKAQQEHEEAKTASGDEKIVDFWTQMEDEATQAAIYEEYQKEAENIRNLDKTVEDAILNDLNKQQEKPDETSEELAAKLQEQADLEAAIKESLEMKDAQDAADLQEQLDIEAAIKESLEMKDAQDAADLQEQLDIEAAIEESLKADKSKKADLDVNDEKAVQAAMYEEYEKEAEAARNLDKEKEDAILNDFTAQAIAAQRTHQINMQVNSRAAQVLPAVHTQRAVNTIRPSRAEVRNHNKAGRNATRKQVRSQRKRTGNKNINALTISMVEESMNSQESRRYEYLIRSVNSEDKKERETGLKMITDSIRQIKVPEGGMTDDYVYSHITEMTSLMNNIRIFEAVRNSVAGNDNPNASFFNNMTSEERETLEVQLAIGKQLGEVVKAKMARQGLCLCISGNGSEPVEETARNASLSGIFYYAKGKKHADELKEGARAREYAAMQQVRKLQFAPHFINQSAQQRNLLDNSLSDYLNYRELSNASFSSAIWAEPFLNGLNRTVNGVKAAGALTEKDAKAQSEDITFLQNYLSKDQTMLKSALDKMLNDFNSTEIPTEELSIGYVYDHITELEKAIMQATALKQHLDTQNSQFAPLIRDMKASDLSRLQTRINAWMNVENYVSYTQSLYGLEHTDASMLMSSRETMCRRMERRGVSPKADDPAKQEEFAKTLDEFNDVTFKGIGQVVKDREAALKDREALKQVPEQFSEADEQSRIEDEMDQIYNENKTEAERSAGNPDEFRKTKLWEELKGRAFNDMQKKMSEHVATSKETNYDAVHQLLEYAQESFRTPAAYAYFKRMTGMMKGAAQFNSDTEKTVEYIMTATLEDVIRNSLRSDTIRWNRGYEEDVIGRFRDCLKVSLFLPGRHGADAALIADRTQLLKMIENMASQIVNFYNGT